MENFGGSPRGEADGLGEDSQPHRQLCRGSAAESQRGSESHPETGPTNARTSHEICHLEMREKTTPGKHFLRCFFLLFFVATSQYIGYIYIMVNISSIVNISDP